MRVFLVVLVIVGLLCAYPPPAAGAAPRTLDRNLDPVIVAGQALPAFSGVSLAQLFVYAYLGSAWFQIPSQLDEVSNGLIVASEDSKLDANDQLVFMGADTGDQAPADAWIADINSMQYPRYEIEVTDPTSPAKKGWVYVYRSATLANTVVSDYVNYETGPRLTRANNYVLRLIQNRIGIDRLEMNGSGINILDRTKLRGYTQSRTFTEEDIPNYPSPVMIRDGRVRIVMSLRTGPTEHIRMIGYRSRFEYNVWHLALPPNATGGRLSVDQSPAAAGHVYYDANNVTGTTVDGIPDTPTVTPPTLWFQVSGSTGTCVVVVDYQGAEKVSTYYKDDKTADPADTGDKMSYGDVGLYTGKPAAEVALVLIGYVLPPQQPRVGSAYESYVRQPLASQSREQRFSGPTPSPSATLTATRTATMTPTRTATVTTTPTRTRTLTVTPTLRWTLTPTHTTTPGSARLLYLPVILRAARHE